MEFNKNKDSNFYTIPKNSNNANEIPEKLNFNPVPTKRTSPLINQDTKFSDNLKIVNFNPSNNNQKSPNFSFPPNNNLNNELWAKPNFALNETFKYQNNTIKNSLNLKPELPLQNTNLTNDKSSDKQRILESLAGIIGIPSHKPTHQNLQNSYTHLKNQNDDQFPNIAKPNFSINNLNLNQGGVTNQTNHIKIEKNLKGTAPTLKPSNLDVKESNNLNLINQSNIKTQKPYDNVDKSFKDVLNQRIVSKNLNYNSQTSQPLSNYKIFKDSPSFPKELNQKNDNQVSKESTMEKSHNLKNNDNLNNLKFDNFMVRNDTNDNVSSIKPGLILNNQSANQNKTETNENLKIETNPNPQINLKNEIDKSKTPQKRVLKRHYSENFEESLKRIKKYGFLQSIESDDHNEDESKKQKKYEDIKNLPLTYYGGYPFDDLIKVLNSEPDQKIENNIKTIESAFYNEFFQISENSSEYIKTLRKILKDRIISSSKEKEILFKFWYWQRIFKSENWHRISINKSFISNLVKILNSDSTKDLSITFSRYIELQNTLDLIYKNKVKTRDISGRNNNVKFNNLYDQEKKLKVTEDQLENFQKFNQINNEYNNQKKDNPFSSINVSSIKKRTKLENSPSLNHFNFQKEELKIQPERNNEKFKSSKSNDQTETNQEIEKNAKNPALTNISNEKIDKSINNPFDFIKKEPTKNMISNNNNVIFDLKNIKNNQFLSREINSNDGQATKLFKDSNLNTSINQIKNNEPEEKNNPKKFDIDQKSLSNYNIQDLQRSKIIKNPDSKDNILNSNNLTELEKKLLKDKGKSIQRNFLTSNPNSNKLEDKSQKISFNQENIPKISINDYLKYKTSNINQEQSKTAKNSLKGINQIKNPFQDNNLFDMPETGPFHQKKGDFGKNNNLNFYKEDNIKDDNNLTEIQLVEKNQEKSNLSPNITSPQNLFEFKKEKALVGEKLISNLTETKQEKVLIGEKLISNLTETKEEKVLIGEKLISNLIETKKEKVTIDNEVISNQTETKTINTEKKDPILIEPQEKIQKNENYSFTNYDKIFKNISSALPPSNNSKFLNLKFICENNPFKESSEKVIDSKNHNETSNNDKESKIEDLIINNSKNFENEIAKKSVGYINLNLESNFPILDSKRLNIGTKISSNFKKSKIKKSLGMKPTNKKRESKSDDDDYDNNDYDNNGNEINFSKKELITEKNKENDNQDEKSLSEK